MIRFKKWAALLCILSLLTGFLSGCVNDQGQDPTTTPATGTIVEGQSTNYVVTVRSAGGLPLAGITLFVYADASLQDLEGYGQTNADGQAVITLPGSSAYSSCWLK